MSEQLLHASEIGPAIEEMGGEAVPERVRTGGRVQTETDQVRLQKPADASRGEASASVIEKERLLARPRRLANLGPSGDPGDRDGTDRTEPLATSFAANPNEILFGVDVGEIQPHEFAHAKPASVQSLVHRSIADAERGIGRDRVQKANDLLHSKQLGKSLRLFRIP